MKAFWLPNAQHPLVFMDPAGHDLGDVSQSETWDLLQVARDARLCGDLASLAVIVCEIDGCVDWRYLRRSASVGMSIADSGTLARKEWVGAPGRPGRALDIQHYINSERFHITRSSSRLNELEQVFMNPAITVVGTPSRGRRIMPRRLLTQALVALPGYR